MPYPDKTPDTSRPDERAPGREVAFTSIFAEHYEACLRIARRLVGDDGLAHDVVQDVFLSWWQADGGGYRPDRGELAPWLSTLTHHKAVDALRSASRHQRIRVAVEFMREPEQRLVDDVVWWEMGRQSLLAALHTLPPKQREVLSLAYVLGLTQTEIAERLGIPVGTVKSRTHTGILRLRAALHSTWTPAGATAPAPLRELADLPVPVRSLRDARPERPAERMPEDVEACAADLLEIAAGQADQASGVAAMIGRAAALVDKHGKGAVYELVVLLARRSVTDGSAGSSASMASDAAAARRAD